MLLTLTSTTAPARDLGFLLRKHPDRFQTFELSAGSAHVFYPEANDARCTAALMLDIDPVALVRGRPSSTDGGLIETYVNDRPYAVSSFMSVAIAKVYGQALGGRSDRPELASRPMALEAVISPVAVDESGLPARLFGPLGYATDDDPVDVPDSARVGHYRRIALSASTTLSTLLSHLYVLIPVLDERKHYWVDEAEVEKLFRHGGEWLAAHPERETITKRYLARAPKLARTAVARLNANDDEPTAPSPGAASGETSLERPLRLQERRIAAVMEALKDARATSVADLGCGDGDLLLALAREASIVRVLGADVAARELEFARDRLSRAQMPVAKREAIELVQTSLLYVDRRLFGFGAVALLEVIEHVEPDRLATLARVVFGAIASPVTIVTTPNREYNVRFASLPSGTMRHPDHRFEWTRAEFTAWANDVAAEYGYSVEFRPIGDVDPTDGPPTQMAIFRCA